MRTQATETQPLLRKVSGRADATRNILVGLLVLGCVAVIATLSSSVPLHQPSRSRAAVDVSVQLRANDTAVSPGGTTPEQDAAADAKTEEYEPGAGKTPEYLTNWIKKILSGKDDSSSGKYEGKHGTSTSGTDNVDERGAGQTHKDHRR